jgi:hypothetical protein
VQTQYHRRQIFTQSNVSYEQDFQSAPSGLFRAESGTVFRSLGSLLGSGFKIAGHHALWAFPCYGTSVALPLDETLIEETGDLAIYA